ncbi:MAG TPA: ASPIC/UnbV domain-containing protein, partial [Calditrichia bacterium]|nr:ASPIC/UnbV domain-containing protein [Calditrichia bacterium]
LYRNDGDGTFTKIAGEVLVSDGGFSACAVWGDYDNDGDLDLAVSNAYGTGALTNFLYRNELIESGNPTFQKVNGDPFVVDPGYTYGLAWGDYDLDGDLDLFAARTLSENQSNALYRNDRVAGNAWVQVDLEGTTSNRSGIGAIVRVKTLIGGQAHWLRRDLSGQDGYCAQTLRLHFGLGDAPRIDSLIVEWPSGIRDVLENPTLNRVLKITEGSAVGIGNPPQGLFQGFELLPNYPNPFNPGTGFGVRMDKSAGVRIKVYNSLGQQVATIFEGPLGRGLHPFRWDGRNTSGEEVVSGNYILLVLVGGWQRQSRLLTLLR